jgi:D-glycerate 3-kinase
VVIFEGWSVGFRPLEPAQLEALHSKAKAQLEISPNTYNGRLGHNTLSSVTDINEALRDYDALTNQLDAFIHIDAADPQYVYKWRLQQEEGLREKRGSGMTDEQVKNFVDGYYPSYELYTETLRQGVFGNGEDAKGRQMRLVVGEDRKVQQVIII